MDQLINTNPLLAVDSYKASHWLQYPPGTERIHSYVEARKAPAVGDDHTVFFGLQYILKRYLDKPITRLQVLEAADIFEAHGLPFNKVGWMRVVNKCDGYLPVVIRAVPEGMPVPVGNVLMTVENMEPEFFWLTSYLETLLLRVWYPTTVATRSWLAKKIIRAALLETADDLSGLPFKLHDFGARGVSSGESAAIGGLAHLVNFQGTDTVEALVAADHYYNEAMAGFSIPASEHSSITSWEKGGEEAAYDNMITQFGKPGAIFACVSDSYDIDNAVSHLWGGSLRQKVIDSGATLVVRPDSGDPVATVLRVHQMLDNTFGSTRNSKGYKVLNNVRVIQGDGLDNPSVIEAILAVLKMNGFSADNVAFGMGGGLLQKIDRDTYGFAMKCSAARVNGVWRDVFKEAPGKASKRGRLVLHERGGKFTTRRVDEVSYGSMAEMADAIAAGTAVYASDNVLGCAYVTGGADYVTLSDVRKNTGLW